MSEYSVYFIFKFVPILISRRNTALKFSYSIYYLFLLSCYLVIRFNYIFPTSKLCDFILCHSVSLFFTTCILGTGSFLDHLKLMENPDTQPQIKNHYRGHKLSMWLSLIPQIHSPGDSTDPMRHHHFNEENPQFYDGKRISS